MTFLQLGIAGEAYRHNARAAGIRNAVPKPRRRIAVPVISLRIARFRGRVLHAADFVQLLLQAHLAKRAQRQGCENADALMQHAVGIFEREGNFRRSARSLSRIGNTPMCRHGLTRPDRKDFAGRVVVERKHEIELRRVGLSELILRFRTKAGCVVAEILQEPESLGVHSPLGLAAHAVGAEFARAYPIQDGFGENRTRRIAGTKESTLYS